jgi:Fe-S cluster assembly iron-binding protein IscA
MGHLSNARRGLAVAATGTVGAVLALTAGAIEAIRGICEDGDVGPDGGLRISGSGGTNGDSELDFELAAAAHEGDAVVREGGAVVFLDAHAAAALDGKRLDVHAHGDHFHFSLEEQ